VIVTDTSETVSLVHDFRRHTAKRTLPFNASSLNSRILTAELENYLQRTISFDFKEMRPPLPELKNDLPIAPHDRIKPGIIMSSRGRHA